jgi:hypothetical protein
VGKVYTSAQSLKTYSNSPCPLVLTSLVWYDNACFVFQKRVLLEKCFFKKVRKFSRELWWTGSPVAVFENENQWETAKIPRWFSPGDFVLILKNFLLLWERMHFEKIQNVLQNNPA